MCTSVLFLHYVYISVIYFLFIGVANGSDDNQAKLRFYYNLRENFTELPLDEVDKIFSTGWYDPSKMTLFWTHGFTGHPNGPAVTAVINACLEYGKFNVVLLNWDRLAAMALPGVLNSYMNWAIPNAVQLGADFSEALLKLSAAGLDLNKTHFAGHSLGAHVFGITGNKMLEKGFPLPWITGLDPATGFDLKPAMFRLNPNSANFTVAVHTDPHKYGSKRELGLVNFWPNFRRMGFVIQPGCSGENSARFSDDDFCSHNRAWQLWLDSLQNPGTILGSHAKNFRVWNKYSKEEREENVLELGPFSPNALPGNYFLTTAEKPSYGLMKEGL